jgi:hypothetical protein
MARVAAGTKIVGTDFKDIRSGTVIGCRTGEEMFVDETSGDFADWTGLVFTEPGSRMGAVGFVVTLAGAVFAAGFALSVAGNS